MLQEIYVTGNPVKSVNPESTMCCLAERPSSSELNNSGLWEPMHAAEITRHSAEAERNTGPRIPKIPHTSLKVGGVILAPSPLMITGQTKAKFRETAVLQPSQGFSF